MSKEVKMYELKGSDVCKTKRVFPISLLTSETLPVKKASAVKSVLFSVLNGTVSKEDAYFMMLDLFRDLPFPSQKQMEVQAKDAYKQIMRYVNSETRISLIPKGESVDLGRGISVFVLPDFIYEEEDAIEFVRIHCSKPQVSQSGAYECLELYALMKYARKFVGSNPDKKILKASLYYLRKNNDSNSRIKPNFDEDFFSIIGAGNVVTIKEYPYGIGSKSTYTKKETDEAFEKALEEFDEGFEAEECDEDDCKNCDLFDVCHYTEPPTALSKAPVQKSVSDLCLTKEQEKAVEYEKGICRINAGAGAGKTMVISLRTVTLLNKGVKPEEILLITFTNAAAEEMRQRIKLYNDEVGTGEDISDMKIMTFNAFGDLIIKEEYESLGFTAPPRIIDNIERSRIIADLLNSKPVTDLDYRNFTANMSTCKGAITIANKVFAIIKEGQYSLSDADEVYAKLDKDKRFCSITSVQQLIELYDQYDEKLIEQNLIEYQDQEGYVFDILHKNPFYLETFNIKHVVVDEFQDTNERQIELLRYFINSKDFQSLMVIGDDSQSIYSFRNTTPDFIINFESIIGKSIDDIYLVENHRSTPEIIEFANKLNKLNMHRVNKDLIPTRKSGAPVVVRGFLEDYEEKEFVINEIKDHLAKGCKAEDMAVICRTKAELLKIASLLNENGIPSVMAVPEPIVLNSRVRSAIAFLRTLHNTNDTKDALSYANAKMGGNILNLPEDEINKKIEETFQTAKAILDLKSEEDQKNAVKEALEAIDLHDDEVYQSFLESLLKRPMAKIADYGEDFLLYGENEAMKRNNSYPGIVLTTAHSSKGLEWPVCFNMISKYDKKEMHTGSSTARMMTEETRRLLFVSATRARDELYITGKYTAFGKKGDYTYNRFLVDSYHVCGQEFSIKEIEAERLERQKQKKKKKKDGEVVEEGKENKEETHEGVA